MYEKNLLKGLNSQDLSKLINNIKINQEKNFKLFSKLKGKQKNILLHLKNLFGFGMLFLITMIQLPPFMARLYLHS